MESCVRHRGNSIATRILVALALSSPSFAQSTKYVVSLPEVARPIPMALIGLIALCVMHSEGLRQNCTLFALAGSVLCIGLEVGCAFLQRWCYEGWNYLCVNECFRALELTLRLAVLGLFLVTERRKDLGASGACLVRNVSLGIVGLLAALALWGLGAFDCSWDATLALSLAGWAYVAALLAACFMAGGFGECVSQGVLNFSAGALLGNGVSPLVEHLAGAVGAAPAVVALLFAAAPFVSLALCRKLQVSSSTDADMSKSVDDLDSGAGRMVSILGNMPGSEFLSHRETQVALAELSGKDDSRISADLGIKAQTIATYRSRIYRKLSVDSHVEFLELARESSTRCCVARANSARNASGGTVAAGWTPLATLARAGLYLAIYLAAFRVIRLIPIAGLRRAILVVAFGLMVLRGVYCPGALHEALIGSRRVFGCICGCLAAVCPVFIHSVNELQVIAGFISMLLGFVWLAEETRGPQTRQMAEAACGLAGFGLVCSGMYEFAGPMPQIQVALVLSGLFGIATLGLDRRLAEKELSDAVLLGDARCDAYLRGRGLSQLESSVLILSARRMHRAAIAEALSVSIATVSTYKARAIKKLRVSNIDEAVRVMREEGGLELD